MGYFGDTWKLPFFALEAIGQKMANFKSRQNTPCGYSKLVPEDAWQDAKGFRSIWSFHPEKTSKMANFHHILDVFSGLNDQIDLNPFASCQTSSGTSLEYRHGVFWRDLKIAIFVLWPLGQKLMIFKYCQNTPCGYSKLVPEDAWQDAKGFRSIWSFNPEKTSKMWWKSAILEHFGCFLQTWWMYGPKFLCILTGIFWHKVWVPTWVNLVRLINHHFCPRGHFLGKFLGVKTRIQEKPAFKLR